MPASNKGRRAQKRPADSPSTSSQTPNDALDRLTNMMANFIEAQGVAAKRPVRNYESVPAFDPENKDQSIDKWCSKVDELSKMSVSYTHLTLPTIYSV